MDLQPYSNVLNQPAKICVLFNYFFSFINHILTKLLFANRSALIRRVNECVKKSSMLTHFDDKTRNSIYVIYTNDVIVHPLSVVHDD